jgi:hypothetical protein
MAEAAVMEETKSEVRNPKSEMGAGSDRVVKHIMCKLTAFDKAIAESKILEIDGLAVDNRPCEEVTPDSRIKVLNHNMGEAFEVSVDAIVRQPLEGLIRALETGLFTRLHGVTRIVGYYSRINNWNKSKIGELQDTHKGDYSVGKTKQDAQD